MKIRPYEGSDEKGVLKVWQTAMPNDSISESLFRTQVLLDSNFLSANLLVAEVGENVVGFILGVTRQVPLFLQGLEPDKAWITAFGVHPDYRRQGIGKALFEHLISRLADDNRKTLEISPYIPNYFVPGVDIHAYPDTVTFLEKVVGFETRYHAISMGADLTDFQIPPSIQELIKHREQHDNLTIMPICSADIPELTPFLIDHFGWDWYRHAQSYLLEYFGSNPQRICFLVARLNGKIVGFCQQRDERFGPFGVHPDFRGRDIGRVLLFKCLEIMKAQHVFYSYFLWTGEEAARLYVIAGYERRREFAVLRKEI